MPDVACHLGSEPHAVGRLGVPRVGRLLTHEIDVLGVGNGSEAVEGRPTRRGRGESAVANHLEGRQPSEIVRPRAHLAFLHAVDRRPRARADFGKDAGGGMVVHRNPLAPPVAGHHVRKGIDRFRVGRCPRKILEQRGEMRIVGHHHKRQVARGGNEQGEAVVVDGTERLGHSERHFDVHEPRALIAGRAGELKDLRSRESSRLDLHGRLAVGQVGGTQVHERLLKETDDVGGKAQPFGVGEVHGRDEVAAVDRDACTHERSEGHVDHRVVARVVVGGDEVVGAAHDRHDVGKHGLSAACVQRSKAFCCDGGGLVLRRGLVEKLGARGPIESCAGLGRARVGFNARVGCVGFKARRRGGAGLGRGGLGAGDADGDEAVEELATDGFGLRFVDHLAGAKAERAAVGQ